MLSQLSITGYKILKNCFSKSAGVREKRRWLAIYGPKYSTVKYISAGYIPPSITIATKKRKKNKNNKTERKTKPTIMGENKIVHRYTGE